MSDVFSDDDNQVVYRDPHDIRDLNAPENVLSRTPRERAQAALYFLRAGAVEPFRQRMFLIQQAEPDFVLDLHGEDLTNACLWKASLAGINFRGARLAWSDLSYADLRGADLSGANLIGVEMRKADLSNANLSGADLRGADLTGAILTGANLEGAQQGELSPEMQRDNPNYLRVEQRKRMIRERAEAAAGSTEGISGVAYSAPKRDYGGGAASAGAKGADPGVAAKAAKEEAMEKRRDLQKGNLKKFQEKKRSEKRFQDKKAADNKKFQEKKRQDQAAFDRKNKK